MTIDEHFLLMIILEGLIFLLGILIIWRGQRQQTKLIENIIYNPDYAAAVAKNMVFGFMEDVNNDKEKQETFFQFVASCGINAAVGVRNYFGGVDGTGAAGIKLKARSPLKPLEGVINQVLPGMIDKIIKGKADKVVDSAIGEWG